MRLDHLLEYPNWARGGFGSDGHKGHFDSVDNHLRRYDWAVQRALLLFKA